MKITAIIPARSGSKGVPGKNIRSLLGKPLIAWSIEQALAAHSVGRVIVSTDSAEIADIARRAGADVPGLRPAALAEDHSPTEAALCHAVEQWCLDARPDAVMLLQPTAPCRLHGSIDRAVETFLAAQADSLLSTCASHSFFWKGGAAPQALYDYRMRPMRQDIAPEDLRFRENGSIYITKTDLLLRDKNRLGGKIVMYCMEECESLDIDSEVDFLIAEALMHKVNYRDERK